MTTTTIDQVQRLIDRLTPLEQVRILEYLTPRIVRTVVTTQPTVAIATKTANSASLPEAWQTFFRIGDEIMVSDRADIPTLTQAVQEMRR